MSISENYAAGLRQVGWQLVSGGWYYPHVSVVPHLHMGITAPESLRGVITREGRIDFFTIKFSRGLNVATQLVVYGHEQIMQRGQIVPALLDRGRQERTWNYYNTLMNGVFGIFVETLYALETGRAS